MNKNAPYETLIAAKLDQVPVPEMADTIWSSIESQLDALEQTPDSENNALKNDTTRLKGKGWYGLSGALIIATAAWLYTTQKTPEPDNSTPAQETVMPVGKAIDSITNEIRQEEHPMPVKKGYDTMSIIHVPDIPSLKDSVTVEIPAPIPLSDSPMKHQERVFDKIDTIMEKRPLKKPRGVKGLTDDDYKIKVIKDSSVKRE